MFVHLNRLTIICNFYDWSHEDVSVQLGLPSVLHKIKIHYNTQYIKRDHTNNTRRTNERYNEEEGKEKIKIPKREETKDEEEPKI
ncbi:hypothetical protein Avbf_11571 [Armadillidium vulgare]|nr:hypothetical protein Avbf_11571 [Armadillidium vulgare]